MTMKYPVTQHCLIWGEGAVAVTKSRIVAVEMFKYLFAMIEFYEFVGLIKPGSHNVSDDNSYLHVISDQAELDKRLLLINECRRILDQVDESAPYIVSDYQKLAYHQFDVIAYRIEVGNQICNQFDPLTNPFIESCRHFLEQIIPYTRVIFEQWSRPVTDRNLSTEMYEIACSIQEHFESQIIEHFENTISRNFAEN